MKYCPLCGKNYDDEAEICGVDGAILRISGKKDPYLGNLIKGRYQVLSKLGEGGMGTVYLAEQVSVGRKVAIKFLLGNYASDDAFIGRFRREARLAASLNHRNIVIVYDFDQATDGTLFIVMEYLDGQKLSDVIRNDGSLEIARATRLGLQIAEGLEAAHHAGVIHRDIKPDNIMVAGAGVSEEIKLMDFGIARLRNAGNASQITRAGVIMGTPAYMAPEQVEGGEVSDKTDIYALGIVLYEILSGNVPFKASTPGAVLIKQLQETPLPLRKLRRELPVALERVAMRALEKEPAKRQRNMDEVVQQLREAAEQLRVKAPSRTREAALGWGRIGQAFRKSEETKAVERETQAEQLPPQFDDSRTMLDNPGPPWAPTQVLSGADVYPPKARRFTSYKLMALLIVMGLAGVLGTIAYWNRGLYVSNDGFKSTETSAPAPAPEIVSLAINSEKRNLAPKERMILNVSGRLSDGTEQEVSNGLKWRSSNRSVVSIDSTGQVEAQSEGIAEVTAEFKEQVSPPITLVVKAEKAVVSMPAPTPAPTLRSLIIVSPKRELYANERIAMSARARYSDSKETEVNEGVTWKSSDERIASIDAKGQLTAHSGGQVRLNATYEGVTSPAISLVVKDAAPPEPQVRVPPRQTKSEIERARPDIRENLRIASIFYEEGKYSEAMVELEHAIRIDPESKEARSLRVRVLRAWEAEKRLTGQKP